MSKIDPAELFGSRVIELDMDTEIHGADDEHVIDIVRKEEAAKRKALILKFGKIAAPAGALVTAGFVARGLVANRQ